jgi:hypothetical protein
MGSETGKMGNIRKHIFKVLEFRNCTVAGNKLIIMQSYTIFAVEGAIQFMKDQLIFI